MVLPTLKEIESTTDEYQQNDNCNEFFLNVANVVNDVPNKDCDESTNKVCESICFDVIAEKDDNVEEENESSCMNGDKNSNDVNEKDDKREDAGNDVDVVTTMNNEDLHVKVNRVRPVTMKVSIGVAGEEIKAVIDTGAEVTVINEKIYNSLPDDHKPQLRRASRGLVVAEKGKKMRTLT